MRKAKLRHLFLGIALLTAGSAAAQIETVHNGDVMIGGCPNWYFGDWNGETWPSLSVSAPDMLWQNGNVWMRMATGGNEEPPCIFCSGHKLILRGRNSVYNTVYNHRSYYEDFMSLADMFCGYSGNRALDCLSSLRPVSYMMNCEVEAGSPVLHRGFLAQDVEMVLPGLVSTEAGHGKTVSYTGMVPLLAKGIGGLQAKMMALRAELDKDGGTSTGSNAISKIVSFAGSGHATVHCDVCDKASDAYLLVTTLDNSVVRKVAVKGGAGQQLSLDTGDFVAGTYRCALFVDNSLCSVTQFSKM